MACGATAVGLTACGAGSHPVSAATSSVASATVAAAATTTVTTTVTTTTTATVTLPGAGKPPVTIGDENLPEQFILGQLYYQALKAQGFQVTLNPSIGPTQVVMQSLATGQLAMYPEYLDNWDSQVAGLQQPFKTRDDAYLAGLSATPSSTASCCSNPTPFSDTNAIAVAFNYAVENEIQSISGPGQDVAPADPRRPAPVPAEHHRPAGHPEHLRPRSRRRSSRSRSAPNTRRSIRAPSRPRSSTPPTPSS